MGFGSANYPGKPDIFLRATHPVLKTVHGAMGGKAGSFGDLVRDSHAGSQFRQAFESGLNHIAWMYSANIPEAKNKEDRFIKIYANHPDAVGSGYDDVRPMSAEEIRLEIRNRLKRIKSGEEPGDLSHSHNRFTGEKGGGGSTFGTHF